MKFPVDKDGITKLVVPVRMWLEDQEHATICFKDGNRNVPIGIFIKFAKNERKMFEPALVIRGGAGHLQDEGDFIGNLVNMLANTIESGDRTVPTGDDWKGCISVLEYWIERIKGMKK